MYDISKTFTKYWLQRCFKKTAYIFVWLNTVIAIFKSFQNKHWMFFIQRVEARQFLKKIKNFINNVLALKSPSLRDTDLWALFTINCKSNLNVWGFTTIIDQITLIFGDGARDLKLRISQICSFQYWPWFAHGRI